MLFAFISREKSAANKKATFFPVILVYQIDPRARNFSDTDYRRGEKPVDFYLAIIEGHVSAGTGGDMPAYGTLLTSDQRWDVVYYTWRSAAPDESLILGQELYQVNCEDCHGPTGPAGYWERPISPTRLS